MTEDLTDMAAELVTHAARVSRIAREHLRDAPWAGVRVLSLLDQHGASAIGELANRDRCTQPTMSGVVKGLVDRGWVAKQAHPDDARASLVSLTDAGRDALADVRTRTARTVVDGLTTSKNGPITTDELATAIRVLRAAGEPREKGSK